MKNNTILWVMIGLLLIAVAGTAIYKIHPLLFPEILITAPVDPECDLRTGSCATQLEAGGRVTFSITPLSIPVIKSLELQVEIAGLDVDAVEIDFSGVDMNMGFNRPKLSGEGNGRFVGKGILPVCVRDAMEWEAKVLLHTQRGLVAVPYRFITVKPGMEYPGASGQE